MIKKFFTSGLLLRYIFIFISISSICAILSFVLKSIPDMFEILMIFTICSGVSAVFLLLLFIFNCWIVEISEQGILYRNLFKFRKFKRFFSWEELDEIEIIKKEVLSLKQTYITRVHVLYGQKRFMNMRNCSDVIILNTASKNIQEEIKKYYTKNIITGRNFKIAIAQEEHSSKENWRK